MLKLLGLFGGLCFAAAGVPGAYKCLKNWKNPGIPASTAALICSGVFSLYWYMYFSFGFDWVVTASYGVEFLAWYIILLFSIGDLL